MNLFRAAALAAAAAFVPFANTAAGAEPAPDIALRVIRLEPADGASVARKRPEISATFGEAIDPASLRVSVDGNDVTLETVASARNFVFQPTSDLPDGDHAVAVNGKTPDRETFAAHWAFTTSGGKESNFISGLEPPTGTRVGPSFLISGFTTPHARLRVVATTSETIVTFSEIATDSIASDVKADAHGYFEVRIEPADRGPGIVDARIASTAADGDVVVKTLRLQR